MNFSQALVNQTPVFDRKPLSKLVRHMIQPRHPKTKKFTKPRRQRKNRKQTYF